METLQEMGIKDLESVVLKAHHEMSIAGRVFEQGEPVLYFQNIQVSQLSERAAIRASRGGYLNQPLVVWEDRENTTFQFSNGTLNQISFNMLLEANMVKKQEVYVPFKQIDEIQGDGKFYYRYQPAEDKKKFFYVFDSGNIQRKISPLAEEKDYAVFDKSLAGQQLLMDYYFLPESIPLLSPASSALLLGISYPIDKYQYLPSYVIRGFEYLVPFGIFGNGSEVLTNPIFSP